jgi:hypothetical protein
MGGMYLTQARDAVVRGCRTTRLHSVLLHPWNTFTEWTLYNRPTPLPS